MSKVIVLIMRLEQLLYWFFVRTLVLVVGFDLLTANYPYFYYPWDQPDYKFWDNSITSKDNQPMPLFYKLDAWSQYDNPEEGSAREGDIRERSYSRKTMTLDENLFWPNGIIHYFVEKTIVNEPEKMSILEGAMSKIMESTCLKFIRVYPNKEGKFPFDSWVNITGSKAGCFSDVGRMNVSPNTLNLDVNKCFRTAGHAIHEILHTLGVFHEHMRPDRNKHIKIVWENIKDGDAFNFLRMTKNDVSYYGLPYDYDSVMHYSMTAFSKDKSKPTIVPLKIGAEIGQRTHLSRYDIQKLMIAYKCKGVTKNTKNPQDRDNNVKVVKSNDTKVSIKFQTRLKNKHMSDTPVGDYKQSPYAWNKPVKFYYVKYFLFPYFPNNYYY